MIFVVCLSDDCTAEILNNSHSTFSPAKECLAFLANNIHVSCWQHIITRHHNINRRLSLSENRNIAMMLKLMLQLGFYGLTIAKATNLIPNVTSKMGIIFVF